MKSALQMESIIIINKGAAIICQISSGAVELRGKHVLQWINSAAFKNSAFHK